MPLADDLIQSAKDTLLAAQASAGGHDAARQQLLDFIAMRPAGLNSLQWMAIDLQRFAGIINAYRAQLRQWVMVYPATTGLMGPWVTVRAIWTRLTPPAVGQLHPRVVDVLEATFRGYVELITH